jgi:hypothetical protein
LRSLCAPLTTRLASGAARGSLGAPSAPRSAGATSRSRLFRTTGGDGERKRGSDHGLADPIRFRTGTPR